MAAMQRDDSAALARNWATILVVDALLGVLVLAAGLLLAANANAVLGAIVVLAGLAYVALTIRRGRRWRKLRADAGL